MVVVIMMMVRYVYVGSCILAVHSSSQFQLNKGTFGTTGDLSRAQKIIRVVRRSSV